MEPHPFIDAHVHFWDPVHLDYEWLNQEPELCQAFLPDDIQAAARNVPLQKAVFVQADCQSDQGFAEVEWIKSLAEKNDWISGIVAFAPVELGNGCEAQLEALEAQGGVCGIRRLIQSESPGFALLPDFVRGVQSVGKMGWPFDLCIKHHQMRDATELVRLCPNTKFVLDHLGKPDIGGAILDPWRSDIAELARLPNVDCKVSGLVTEADRNHWTPGQLQPYLDVVLQAFGPQRLLFGSDWPVVTLATTYEHWIGLVQDWCATWAVEDRQRLFITNAQNVYSL